MELSDLLARRRMTRSFDGSVIDAALLDELCATALWSPTAGNSAGVRCSTLGAESVAAYVDVATDPSWREHSRHLAGLARAGALVLVTARPEDYLLRYGEPDKTSSSLGERENWPLPYWHTDAAMATMALLLLLEERGWQAAIWGSFRHERAILTWAGIENEELFATVFIGHGDGRDVATSSRGRALARRERVRRLRP